MIAVTPNPDEWPRSIISFEAPYDSEDSELAKMKRTKVSGIALARIHPFACFNQNYSALEAN